jgi:hypothetical membrane protein
MFRIMKVSKKQGTAFAWFGMVGVAVFIFVWLSASSIDASWQFGVNTLSEFGVSKTDARYYFNFGCMITGALVIIFGYGRAKYANNAGHVVCGILLALGGVLLALVGVFTMDSDWHKIIAVLAALLLFMAIIAGAAGNWVEGRKIFAGVGIVIVFMLSAMCVAYDIPEFEAYGIILAMIWLLTESVNMLFSERKG